MGRPLKNYDKYLQLIKLYAKACRVKIEFREEPSDGRYIPSRRKICIDKDLPESTEIATLLHEFGHALDDTLYSAAGETKVGKAYNALYDGTPTRTQKTVVIKCEERAWIFGKSIAKSLKIPLGKWFSQEQASALKSYRQTKTQAR